jgi:4-hydroxy-tetrahydrodipicolinate reductase
VIRRTHIDKEVTVTSEARAVLFGCGPIGCSVARYAAQRADIKLVGAVDIDRSLAGRDLGEVAGTGTRLGVSISADAGAVLSGARPDVVLLTTSSSLKAIYPQVRQCVEAGVNVVSSCEELSFPHRKDPEITARIDELAKARGVTVLSSGVNPGFLMDAWPLFMTGVCQEVKRIRVVRVQDASVRRGPFQKKIGAGCTTEEFQKRVADGNLKHVGLPESIAMVASGLGWEMDGIAETIEPVISQRAITTDFVTITPGLVAGVKQVGRGIRAGEELITLEFMAYVGAPESYDAVYITGTPDLEVVIKGGTHGDVATAAMLVNAVPTVIAAPPGLLTMKDLPMVTARGSRAG